MLYRRRFIAALGGLGVAAMAGARQPKIDPSRDPRMGFVGFGPAAETDRIAAVLDKITGFGERYGFRVEAVSQAELEEGKLGRLSGFFVYGAGLSGGTSASSISLTDRAAQVLAKRVKKGAGLVAIHEAAGIAPSSGQRLRNQARRNTWVKLLGGESVGGLSSRAGRIRMADRSFPGMTQLGAGFELDERFLAFKNYDPEVHVVMIQETSTLDGVLYERPPYPVAWLRYHGKGRVFYTGLGYELDGWDGDVLRRCVVGGALWVLRDTEADVSANLMRVTPQAIQAQYPG